jgi:hypothetical protein
MAIVWLRLRSEARQRLGAWVALVLLVAVAGGIVLGALAGARRTDTAYDRLLESANAFDIAVVPVGVPLDFDAIARLPQVDEAAMLLYAFADVDPHPDGRPITLDLLIPADDRMYVRLNRPKVITGRHPDPGRSDEAAISTVASEKWGVAAGDSVTATFLKPDQLGPLFAGEHVVAAGLRATFQIVGVLATPSELLPTSPNPDGLHLTQAFAREHGRDVANAPAGAYTLKRGPADVNPFKLGVERMAGDQPVQFITSELDAVQVRRSVHLQAVALRLFAALTAVCGLLVLGQAFTRQVSLTARDHPALAAMGSTPVQLWAIAMTRAALITSAGALVAVGLAYALSPFTQSGLARDVEPHPGFAFDAVTIVPGALVIVAVSLVVAAVPTWKAIRRRPGDAASSRAGGLMGASAGAPAPRLRLLDRLTGAALPAPALTGVRMATEQASDGGWRLIRGTLVSTVFCITAIAVAATFGASFQHLLRTPSLYGWNWDVLVGNPFLEDSAAESVPALRASRAVSGFSSVVFADVEIGDERALALGFDTLQGSVLPPVVEGRAPLQPDEVLVGTRTLRTIGAGIGDVLTVRVGDRSERARVVGRGVLPSLVDSLDVSGLGEGVLFTDEGLRRLVPDAPRNLFAVQLAQGMDAATAIRQLREDFPEGLTLPEPPRTVADFGRVDSLPAILIALLVVLTVATLAHTFGTAVRRRRRDLAILKTLGFVRSQLRLAVAAQATTVMVLALALGIPLGLAAGRWTWRVFADGLGIVPEPVIPVLAALAIVPLALLVANAVAAVPGRWAGRVQPTAALQAE